MLKTFLCAVTGLNGDDDDVDADVDDDDDAVESVGLVLQLLSQLMLTVKYRNLPNLVFVI